MALSRADLAAIRNIVRQELQAALGPSRRLEAGEAHEADDAWHGETGAMAREGLAAQLGVDAERAQIVAERAEGLVAAARGDRGGETRRLRGLARYRARYSDWWQKLARRTLGKSVDAPVSDAEMLKTMRIWDKDRAAKAKKRRTRR